MLFPHKSRLIGIPGVKRYIEVRPIQGLSSVQKYYIKSKAGQEMLLVLDDISVYNRFEKQAEWINFLASHAIPTNRLLDLGTCNNGQNVYMMLTWIPEVDVEGILKTCNEDTCIDLGKKAGSFLRHIHSVVPPASAMRIVSITDTVNECLCEFWEIQCYFRNILQ